MIISSHVDMFRHLWRNQHRYNKKIQTCDGTKTRLCTKRKLLRPRPVQRTRSSKHRNRATLDGGPTDRCQYVLCHLSVWVEPCVYTIATSHVLPAELWKTLRGVFPWGVFQSCVGKAQKVVIAVYRIICAQCYFRLLHLQTVSFRLEFARTQLCLKGDTCTCILRHENSTSFKFACW